MVRSVRPQGRRWRVVRAFVLRRDLGLCQIRGPRCNGRANTVDHIVKLSQGGAPLDPGNLRAACLSCNCAREGGWRPSPDDWGV